MRFLVDESDGSAVVEYLRGLGHNVVAVAQAMRQAEDRDVLTRAANESRILVINDKDLGELVFRGGQSHPGVLRLRLRDESAANRVAVMKAALEKHADRLSGSFTVATEDGIRISRVAGERREN